MSTMKTITIEFLEEKKTATFKQLWDKVSKELKNDWEEQYPKSSSSDIEKKKNRWIIYNAYNEGWVYKGPKR